MWMRRSSGSALSRSSTPAASKSFGGRYSGMRSVEARGKRYDVRLRSHRDAGGWGWEWIGTREEAALNRFGRIRGRRPAPTLEPRLPPLGTMPGC